MDGSGVVRFGPTGPHITLVSNGPRIPRWHLRSLLCDLADQSRGDEKRHRIADHRLDMPVEIDVMGDIGQFKEVLLGRHQQDMNDWLADGAPMSAGVWPSRLGQAARFGRQTWGTRCAV